MRTIVTLTVSLGAVATKLRKAKGSPDPLDHADLIVAVAALGVVVAKSIRDGRAAA